MSEPIVEAGAWIYKMFITLIVALVAIALVSYTVINDVNTREVQGQLMLNRLLYSPDGFWYQADGQTYPGIVNGALIQDNTIQSVLDSGFIYKHGYGAMRITFIPKPIVIPGAPMGPYYVQKDTFDALTNQIQAGVRHSGTYEQHNYPVIIRRQGGDSPAIMQVELVLPERA